MDVAQRRHFDVAGRHHRSFGVFVHRDELAQIGPALVRDAGLDVELVGVPKAVREPFHAGRTIGIDGCAQPGRPGVVEQEPEFRIVVGMMVGDEDVAQRRQRELGVRQLEAHPVAGIDDVRHVVIDEQIGRRTRYVARADCRAAAGAQQQQPVPPEIGPTVRPLRERRTEPRGRHQTGPAGQKIPACHHVEPPDPPRRRPRFAERFSNRRIAATSSRCRSAPCRGESTAAPCFAPAWRRGAASRRAISPCRH